MKLDKLRKKIDEIDEGILDYLVQRKALVEQISKVKDAQNLPTLDEKRETDILNRLKTKITTSGLDEEFVSSLFKQILSDSKKKQNAKRKQT